ncbi:hypothetical protein CDD81_642 [Ophiocordyceps australis]|uniref:Aquaporin n=1 Tax=Ophiocordyceps australis TaxID=1399860 RepID=A0A2C5Y2R9_9HYPO|nr:hypothetical protein CDD81_642 [Ophiocordyceps australis]
MYKTHRLSPRKEPRLMTPARPGPLRLPSLDFKPSQSSHSLVDNFLLALPRGTTPPPGRMAAIAPTAPDAISESSLDKAVLVSKTDMAAKHDESVHGALPPPPGPQSSWARVRSVWQDAFSEYFGTLILILFGDGVVAQVLLSGNKAGDYQSISWGWGIGVMLGAYTAGKSGGHINPAVTLTNCVLRGMPWRKFPVYVMAQLLGAMTAAAIVYGNYKSAIDKFEGGNGVRTVGGPTSTAGIFCTYPVSFITRTGMFFSEFIASAILQFVIFVLSDMGNNGAGPLMPICLFFLIFGIGACFGWETGYAINMARDFGPRLVSYMIGYGNEVWSAGGYYFWIPMVAPFCGALAGGTLYDVFIFTGESPVNKPWFGLDGLFKSRRREWPQELDRADTRV